MGVESNFELYTFLWGWHQYEALWEVLKATGIALIPFAGMLFNAFISAYGSQDPGQAAFATVRALEVNVISALVVIILAVQPTVKVEVGALEYVRICVGSQFIDKKEKVPDIPDNLGLGRIEMSEFEQVKLPAFWFGVLSVSHGIVHAAKKGIPCVDDIRQIRIAVHHHSIDDIQIINDLIRFGNQCYLPAMSKFVEDEKNLRFPVNSPEDQFKKSVFKFFGRDDTSWLGSQYLYLNDRYYKSLPGYTIIESVDNKQNRLNCSQEWQRVRDDVAGIYENVTDPASGDNIVEVLLTKVSDPSDISVPSDIQAAINEREGGGTNINEYIVGQSILRALMDAHVAFDPITFAKDRNWGFIYKKAVELSVEAGEVMQSVTHYATVDMFIKTIPFLGGLMLMAIYVFLPLGLVFSGYSVQFLLVGAIGIFGVKFYYYLWHLVWWLDQNVLLMFARSDGTLKSLFQTAHETHEATLGFVITSLYFIMPLLWTMVVSWAGYSGVQMLTGATDSATAKAQQIGQTASSIIDRGFHTGVGQMVGYGLGAAKAADWVMYAKDDVKKASQAFEISRAYLDELKKENAQTIKQTKETLKEQDRLQSIYDRYKREKGAT